MSLSVEVVGRPQNGQMSGTDFLHHHLNSNNIGTGEGRSKKQAEQAAAKEALKLMGVIR